jgi:hypothetical protein
MGGFEIAALLDDSIPSTGVGIRNVVICTTLKNLLFFWNILKNEKAR